MSLFEPKPPVSPKATGRATGLLFLLGAALALAGVVYLLGFLGD